MSGVISIHPSTKNNIAASQQQQTALLHTQAVSLSLWVRHLADSLSGPDPRGEDGDGGTERENERE